MGKYYLGIDVGTFETKGVLIDDCFQVVTTASSKHSMDNPRPNFFEQDAEEIWWKDFCIVSRALIEKSGIQPEEIAAVGSDVLGCDCLPVDENCKPLRKAILYGIDARASEEIKYLSEYFGEERVKELFGHPLCSDDIAPKILWIKNHEPEIYKKTYKFLTGSSYIAAKLTGNYVIDQFLAKSSFSPMYDTDGHIREEECSIICRPDQMARAMYVHEIAGTVTAKAALETGLKEGTPVICGTGDSTSEAISVGITVPGKLMFQFGSSLFFYYCADRLIYDHRVYGNHFTVPGTFSISGGTNTVGTLTRWMRDTLYFDLLEEQKETGVEPYELMMERIRNIPAGSDGLVILPYFAGERCPINDANAKGMFFGLTLEHTRDHIYRAALEGIAYCIHQNIQVLEGLGLQVNELIAVGGGTKNPVWMQIVADVIQKPVCIPKISIGASYGEAMMAALGIGDLKDFQDLSEKIEPDQRILPNPENAAVYNKLYKIYDELYQHTKDLMHQL